MIVNDSFGRKKREIGKDWRKQKREQVIKKKSLQLRKDF